MDLDLLRTFLAVYRAGSITAAARRLGLSQPTVTAQLKALEAATGRPLFTRLPRGVTPTPAGDLLARRVSDPLDQLARVTELDEPAGLAAVVHLGGPAEFLTEVVLPALAALVAEGLQLRVTFGLPDELAAGLRDGAIDVAMLSQRPRVRGLHVEAIGDEDFLFVGPPGGTVEAPLIAYAEDLPIIRRYWLSEFGERPPRDAAVVVPSLLAVRALVLAGAGCSVLPEYLVADDLAASRLVRLHEPALGPLNTVYLATRAGEPPTPGRDRVLSVLRATGLPTPR
ncbi:LysR family transcriptional regulator [Actinoplanes solisilvae]|uniref:LysR family transcriptional regulator n=1 Tax=Actinoplanes solisilvae TaxID=2486853 RepID=UPI00196B8AB3|nr:LysR family transcriptional regulator [Actinoplanes solisilvae]